MPKCKPLLLSSLLSVALFSVSSVGAESNRNQLPEIGSAGGSILSIEKERQIGDIAMRQLRASQPLLNDPVLTEYINHLGNRLVKNANDVNYSFKFFLINNPEINAFAFFGGHVGIHTGLITQADTESELASVLAHEVSHVTQRHLARRLESQHRTQPLTTAGLISGVLLTLVNPGVGLAALSTSLAAGQQASINYTRGNEKEADRVGISLLANSGFNPHASAEFFGKLAEKYRYRTKPPAMLLTHPLPESRISDARGRAQAYPYIHLAPSLDFELSKARITARYQGEVEQNIAYYQDVIERNKYAIRAAAQYGLALSYFRDRQFNKAQKLLESLYQSDQLNLFYVDALSDAYIQTKRFNKALAILDRLNKLMPNNQVVALNYANVLQENKQYEQATQLLNDFLLVKPNHFVAYDLLTTVYRKQEETALMHATKAEVLALLGGYSQAVDELQTAYNYADKQPIVRKRIKARILQLQAQEQKIKRL